MAQCDGKLHPWFNSLSVVGIFICYEWCYAFMEFIKEYWANSEEVVEGLMTKLSQVCLRTGVEPYEIGVQTSFYFSQTAACSYQVSTTSILFSLSFSPFCQIFENILRTIFVWQRHDLNTKWVIHHILYTYIQQHRIFSMKYCDYFRTCLFHRSTIPFIFVSVLVKVLTTVIRLFNKILFSCPSWKHILWQLERNHFWLHVIRRAKQSPFEPYSLIFCNLSWSVHLCQAQYWSCVSMRSALITQEESSGNIEIIGVVYNEVKTKLLVNCS